MFWEIVGYTVLAMVLFVGFAVTAFIFCVVMDLLQRGGAR